MNQPIPALAIHTFTAPQVQGTLFASAPLPRQLRAYKSELEDEFLPPRDQRLKARLPH